MNLDSDVLDMIAKFAAMNVVVLLLLAVLSYAWSVMALNAVALLDRWLDPSRKLGVRSDNSEA